MFKAAAIANSDFRNGTILWNCANETHTHTRSSGVKHQTYAGNIDNARLLQELALCMQGAVQIAAVCPLDAKDSGLVDQCTDCIASMLAQTQVRAHCKEVRESQS